MRRDRATIVVVEKQWVLRIVCVCVCVFVALGIQHCNAHASYCHLWPAPLYHFFHIIS